MKVLISTFLIAVLFFSKVQAANLVENFQGFELGASLPLMSWGGTVNGLPQAVATIMADPTDETNHILNFVHNNWNSAPVVSLTLPAGKSLADFYQFTFNGFFVQGDIGWKLLGVIASSALPTTQFVPDGAGSIGTFNRNAGPSTAWELITIPISGSPSMTGTVYLAFGMNAPATNQAGEATTWRADNVTLVARPQTTSFSIASTATEITVPEDFLEMSVIDILPANARADHTWSVDRPYVATIDAMGILTAVANGTVVVRATANDGSGVFAETTITVSGQATTAIQDNPVSATVAFPNPVSDVLNIAGGEVISRVVVSNLAGAAVLSLNANDTNLQVNVSSLPAGIYVVTVETASGNVQNLRVVKR